MPSKTALTLLVLISTSSTIVTANGQGQQPEALIRYNTTSTGDGSIYSTDLNYMYWNQNLSLNGVTASSMQAVGGNTAADQGYSCIFASGGNPGDNHTITLHGPPADLATNPVEIKWICCGDCATVNNSVGNSTSSGNLIPTASATGSNSPASTGNFPPSSAPSPSPLADSNDGAVSRSASVALTGALLMGTFIFGL